MVACRGRLNLSINQIAEVFRRSPSTVHRYAGLVARDNRRLPDRIRHLNNLHFMHKLPDLRLRMKMYLEGLAGFNEVVKSETVPLVALDWFLELENCTGDEGEDPA